MLVILTLLVVFVTPLLGLLYDTVSYYWLTPRSVRKLMERQGVRGPKPRLFTGNIRDVATMVSRSVSNDMQSISHDIVGRLLPHYVAWSEQYGKRFIFWNGTEPRLCLTETEMIKELLTKYNGVSGKSWLQQQGSKHFTGKGLLMANGTSWYHQRRITTPAFMGERLKSYAGHMVECTKQMLESLSELAAGSGQGEVEIEIGEHMTKLTADIIARTEFGSSYDKGMQIFNLLEQLQRFSSQASRHLCYPGSRFFPSKYNREIKSLKDKIQKLIMEIIQNRKDCVEIGRSSSFGNDLLGLLLDEMQKEKRGTDFSLTVDLIMDECKTFFFAGHETTALLLTWTVMLLASNPTWQDKVREQVRQVCGGEIPTVDHLSKLTVLNMVINETLRLYPPATLLPRMAFEDIKLGDLVIPKGLSIWIPMLAIHHNEELWGKDANEFNPERFETRTFAPGRHFMPFAAGPRNCIGQSFALMEARIILAMLISKFSFTISENYRHAPIIVLTIKPKHGVQVHLKPLDP